MRERIIRGALPALLVTVIFTMTACGHTDYTGLSVGNRDETVAAIRQGYRHRAGEITLHFNARNDNSEDIASLTSELITEAMQETDSPEEGDYLRYQNGGYSLQYSVTPDKKGYEYTISIIPRYYTYLYQEEYVTERVEEILKDILSGDEWDDREKAARIYGYIYDTVGYDKVHKDKGSSRLKNTAYAALYYHTAECQGYSVLFYRLAGEAGIPVRVVTGTLIYDGISERHAWNMVYIENKWYGIDVTADSVTGKRSYCLHGRESFDDHIPDEEFACMDMSDKDMAF